MKTKEDRDHVARRIPGPSKTLATRPCNFFFGWLAGWLAGKKNNLHTNREILQFAAFNNKLFIKKKFKNLS